jgi:hypothetical protein
MSLTIGYIVVIFLAVLDIYYSMNLSKRKKAFIYTPFEAMSGIYNDIHEEVLESDKTNSTHFSDSSILKIL